MQTPEQLAPAASYSPLAPLTEAVNVYTEAAISLCAPHGLRPVCFIESDSTGQYLNIEARDANDNVFCTGMGADPLLDLRRQLPQTHATACEVQRAGLSYINRTASL
jgi:hypothetical protein